MSLARSRAARISYVQRFAAGLASPPPPLVLLHGVGSNADSWATTIARLGAENDVLAWDAPGYGASTPIDAAYPTPSLYAARLLDLLDDIGLERVVLVGHSLGCLFATSFARAYPRRVAALALLSPALGHGVPAGEGLPANVQARIDDLAALGAEKFAAARAPRLVYQPETKPGIVAGVRRAMAAVNPSGYAQAVRALGAGALLADAAVITARALVAVGAEDVVTPPENARAVHAVLRDAKPLEIIADCGHALPQEAPGRIAALLGALAVESAHV